MATAGDQINRALRLLGQLAESEVPSAATSQDALVALNQMLDSWDTERLSVFCTQDQVFAWPAGQVKRTLGPTGDFVGTRPIEILDSTYFVSNGISYGIDLLNEDQYNAIALKTSTSTFPQVLYVNADFPNASLFIYPEPTQVLDWHIISVAELTKPALLSTDLLFPPGYLRAFTYNLACELAPEFGVEPSPQVVKVAMTSKRNLKRINNPDDLLRMPIDVLQLPRFNIYSGNY